MSSRDEQKAKIHASHEMGKPRSEILAPAGTPRFYTVVSCKKCEAGYAEHAAGFFFDKELTRKCNE